MLSVDDRAIDLALLERMVARDGGAIAALYDRHSRLLYGLILRILRDKAEAEEVLQEVFLLSWTRAETFKPDLGSPTAWLVRIARNCAIDRLRANSVRTRTIDAVSVAVPESAEMSGSDVERRYAVTGALEALPPEQRDLIEHAYFLGLTHTELAARFGLPLGTIKTRIRTGMLALKQTLQPHAAADAVARQ